MNKKALVICNGEPTSKKLVQTLAKKCDLIVAADGGANWAFKMGIRPDVVIGDFDSVASQTRRGLKSSKWVHVLSQDNTDFEKAMDYLVEEGFEETFVVGSTGKRIDFTVGNFFSIWKYVSRIQPTFVNDDWFALPVIKKVRLEVPIGTSVSLIPFSPCSKVTLRGFQFPLTNASMNLNHLGLSNLTIRKKPTISLTSGNLLAMVLKK